MALKISPGRWRWGKTILPSFSPPPMSRKERKDRLHSWYDLWVVHAPPPHHGEVTRALARCYLSSRRRVGRAHWVLENLIMDASQPLRCLRGFPEGPKIEKNSRFRSGIEIFKRPILDWNFQSRLKISIEIENEAPVVGNYQGRDWNFQARLKFSIEIEIFNPGLKFSSVWIENFTRSIGIEFFQSQGPLGWVRHETRTQT